MHLPFIWIIFFSIGSSDHPWARVTLATCVKKDKIHQFGYANIIFETLQKQKGKFSQ